MKMLSRTLAILIGGQGIWLLSSAVIHTVRMWHPDALTLIFIAIPVVLLLASVCLWRENFMAPAMLLLALPVSLGLWPVFTRPGATEPFFVTFCYLPLVHLFFSSPTIWFVFIAANTIVCAAVALLIAKKWKDGRNSRLLSCSPEIPLPSQMQSKEP